MVLILGVAGVSRCEQCFIFGPGGDLRCTDTTAHDMYSENVCWTPKAAEKTRNFKKKKKKK